MYNLFAKNVICFMIILLTVANAERASKNNLKSKLGWSRKYWFVMEGGQVKIYNSYDTCRTECPSRDCYEVRKYEDFKKILRGRGAQDTNAVCFEVKNALPDDTAKVWDDGIKFNHQDICDSYCQPVKGKLCGWSKNCGGAIDCSHPDGYWYRC